MAHIRKMTDKRRTLPWRAHVHRKGCRPFVKMHKTRADAERWAAEQERQIALTGLPLTTAELKKYRISDIVLRYIHEISPQKASSQTDFLILHRFLATFEFGSKSLAHF